MKNLSSVTTRESTIAVGRPADHTRLAADHTRDLSADHTRGLSTDHTHGLSADRTGTGPPTDHTPLKRQQTTPATLQISSVDVRRMRDMRNTGKQPAPP